MTILLRKAKPIKQLSKEEVKGEVRRKSTEFRKTSQTQKENDLNMKKKNGKRGVGI